MFVIKICHSYEQFYITVTKKKLSYEMHQYDEQCLLLLQKIFISVGMQYGEIIAWLLTNQIARFLSGDY